MKNPSVQFKENKKKKTLFVKKISLKSNTKYKTELTNLFDDPATYLRLPGETQHPFVVGKKLTGPRHDEDDQIIPYSIVGTTRLFKKKAQSNNNSTSRQLFGPSRVKTSRNGTLNSDSISDKQLERLFTKFKEHITETNDRDSYISAIPPRMEDKVIKELKSQEICLEKHSIHEEYRKSLSDKIKKKLYCSYYTPPSCTYKVMKLKQRKDLLMEQVDMYRMKKETKDYAHTITNDLDPDKRYGKYSWVIGLRRKKNTQGIRRNYINIGNQERPVWCTIREHLPIITETVVAPGEKSGDKKFMQSTSVDTYIKASPSLVGYMSKTLNLVDIEINGKNLLNFEEENLKQMKGKKKLVPLKYEPECVNDLEIAENWRYIH